MSLTRSNVVPCHPQALDKLGRGAVLEAATGCELVPEGSGFAPRFNIWRELKKRVKTQIFLGANRQVRGEILLDRRMGCGVELIGWAIYGGRRGGDCAIWWFWLWGVVVVRVGSAKEKKCSVSILRRLVGALALLKDAWYE